MPVLSNPRHEAFAQKMATGSVSAAKAYRETHPKTTAKAAETHGPRLVRNGQVSGRIAELQGEAAKGVVFEVGDAIRY